MNKATWIIAKTTFREIIREKLFIVILLIALGLSLFSLLLGNLSLNEKNKIIFDISLSVNQLTTVFVGIFFSSYLLEKEIEKQTILLVLSRPISRLQFYIGKLMGLALILSIFTLIQSIIPVLLTFRFDLISEILLVDLSIFFEGLILSILASLLAHMTRPMLAFIFAFSISMLGHWLSDLQFFAIKSQDAFVQSLAKVIELITPQFYLFNWKSYLLIEQGINFQQVSWLILHSLSWIFIYLFISIRLFQRKDFV